mgnify:CR=1 FL=1
MDKSQIKILCVDDEPDILEILKYNLSNEGYIVTTAKDGKKAVETAKDIVPNVIIMDIMMPNMDGIEACEELRKKSKFNNTIIMFLSARGEDFSYVAAFDAGADDYINKPIKPKVLIAKVKSLFRRSKTLEKTDNVDVLLKNNVTKLIVSDFGGLEEIELENKYNNQNRFKIDGLMIEAGADPRVEIPISLGINLDDETNEVAVDKDQKTNVSGIFAAGDITNGSNLKQTITAASQGAISALSAYNYCLENK